MKKEELEKYLHTKKLLDAKRFLESAKPEYEAHHIEALSLNKLKEFLDIEKLQIRPKTE